MLTLLEAATRGLEAEVAAQNEASSAESAGATSGGTAHPPDDATHDATDDVDPGTVDPAIAAAWQSMSDVERRRVAQEIVDAELERYDMEPVEISFWPINGNGYWSEARHELAISASELDNPSMLSTLVHEVRHAAQHEFTEQTDTGFPDWMPIIDMSGDFARIEAAYGITRVEIEAWRDNFDPRAFTPLPTRPMSGSTMEEWNAYDRECAAYRSQPIEVDARATGDGFVDNLTFEQLQEYQRRAGVPVSAG